mgnify:FL=1
MPLTKQKHIRFLALDRCFRNRTARYYIEDLLAECNRALQNKDCATISLRTLRNDLNEFEDTYDTIIEHQKDGSGRTYYRYADPDFSIRKAPLTDEELQRLRDTVLMLNRFRGLPQFGWMEELLTQIQTKLHINGHNESVIGLDTNDDIQGLEYLNPLFEAIVNLQPLRIDYRPFHNDPLTWTIHPYFIKQYNTRWFLLGLSEETQTIVNLALDRIRHIESTHIPYLPTDINFTEYFDDVIGVSIPQDAEPVTVQLRFSPYRLPYILSKPLHNTQKVLDREQGIVQIEVIPNNELTALILSYGEDVEVLQPATLRQLITDKINKMHHLYHLCK